MNRSIAWVLILVVPPVLVAGLWLRSYWPARLYFFARHGQLTWVFAEASRSARFAPSAEGLDNTDAALAQARTDARTRWAEVGLEYVEGPSPVPPLVGPARRVGEYRIIGLSYGYVLAATVLACGGLAVLARRRAARAGAGRCRECGYDLRASPGRCPECGAEPGEAAA